MSSMEEELNSWSARRARLEYKMKAAGSLALWNDYFEELKKLDAEVCEDSGHKPCGMCYGCVREGVGPF